MAYELCQNQVLPASGTQAVGVDKNALQEKDNESQKNYSYITPAMKVITRMTD